MQRLKLLGFLLLAVFVLAAVASSSASAASEIKVLPNEAIKLSGEGGEGFLEKANGNEVKCKKTSAESEIGAGKLLGPYHVMFSECTGPLGVTCTGLGEASGTILVLGEYHLVYDIKPPSSPVGVGILFLVNEVHFSCSIVLIRVKGDVLCLILQVNTSTTHNELHCERVVKGKPKEFIYWESGGTNKEVNLGETALLASENTGAFEGSAEQILVLLLAGGKAVEIMA